MFSRTLNDRDCTQEMVINLPGRSLAAGLTAALAIVTFSLAAMAGCSPESSGTGEQAGSGARAGTGERSSAGDRPKAGERSGGGRGRSRMNQVVPVTAVPLATRDMREL
ncbi:MAG: hypothetical protein FJZ00_10945, partial [Candidatus Sericytochromatia bacterium]|nr:hypothetical protein [Candidatus Tanganyikabacteria bacterium]